MIDEKKIAIYLHLGSNFQLALPCDHYSDA